jgi:hypothetical protein
MNKPAHWPGALSQLDFGMNREMLAIMEVQTFFPAQKGRGEKKMVKTVYGSADKQ